MENKELLVLDGTGIVGAGWMLVVDPPSMGTVTTGVSVPKQSASCAKILDAA